MKRSILAFIFSLLLFACKEPEARRPKQHSTTSFYKDLIEKNKKLNNREKRFLEELIKKDTTNSYQTSASGFWYMYKKRDTVSTVVPKPSDEVTIEYDIVDIDNKILYPKQQRTYKVDKQDFIPALQDGIKLMKQGETITFVIPSYRAFGVVGDENKIGINQPIKSTVTLININQSIKNENK